MTAFPDMATRNWVFVGDSSLRTSGKIAGYGIVPDDLKWAG
jgi:hypothetical protein